MKVCTLCKESKPSDEFYTGTRRGKQYKFARCKACHVIINKQQKDNGRDWELKNKYGITLEEYKAETAKRDNRCDICSTQTTLHVDHNHTTGAVRGYLCGSCNRGIGLLKDSTTVIKNALNYLENHE